MHKIDIYLYAIKTWGLDFQYQKLCEEIGELLQASAKVLHGKWNKKRLAQEIADVEIMLEQMKLAYEIEQPVEKYKESKLKRLEKRFIK